MKEIFKKILPDLIVVIIFAAISFAYFFPAITEGRILFQHDSAGGVGSGQESKEYYERTGERTRWTNAIFGGMPTYQMSPSYDSTDSLKFVEKIYHLYLPTYVWYVFIMLLGFYILMRAFNFSVWLSALGAIIWAFSSYFFILISAGHIWKLVTLAYIPPTIAGIVLVYRGKYLWGSIVTALFIALQVLSNHIQMTYYFLFVILFIVIAFFVDAYRKKEIPRFIKGSLILVVAALIGASINLSNLYHTYEYSKETMRGKSELVKPNSNDQTDSGLERSYITQWSYGIGETFTLLIPNVKGGASVPLAENEKAMEKANPMYAGIYSQLGQYWGEQPSTSGPVYVGAFVMMLFILGLFIVKGPMKWALLAATLLSILLSWGKNFMGLTDFFIDYIPMYDKFRAVSSILVIAEFTIPLLAIMALKEIITKPQILKEKIKYLYISFALTGGIALLFAILPRLFFSSFIPAAEMNALQSGLPAEHLAPILSNLEEMRISIFTADAWRSLIIIVIGTVLLMIYNSGKLKARWLIIGITVLCLGDMWSINKRYLNDDQFVDSSVAVTTFKKTPTDEFILQDRSLNYRVLNFAANTFNENNTAYWHKSIGGYHAAKLRRYQEMIEYHISNEMNSLRQDVVRTGGNMLEVDPNNFPVLNMLNTKYFIFPAAEGNTIPVENPYAYGNAWFVDEIKYVNNANEEIEKISEIDPTQTALADISFREELNDVHSAYKDSLSTITLTSYEPNHLTYNYSTAQDGIIVFSEIYYPTWKAYIDGNEVPFGRVNYILRAINVPAGQHQIEFIFKPTSLTITETIAYTALVILLIGSIVGLILSFRKKK